MEQIKTIIKITNHQFVKNINLLFKSSATNKTNAVKRYE